MTALREAAQQALEACEQRLPLKGQAAIIDELNNLRAALVEDAMQKFTDVNQELEAALGCDHCNSPLYAAVKCRVCGRETPIIEPEIKKDKESAPCNKSCAPGYCYCECPHGVTDGNCKECYEAHAEPVQEPAWVCPDSAEHRYQRPGHCEDCGKTLVQERNFCPRCCKRSSGIHTCTLP